MTPSPTLARLVAAGVLATGAGCLNLTVLAQSDPETAQETITAIPISTFMGAEVGQPVQG